MASATIKGFSKRSSSKQNDSDANGVITELKGKISGLEFRIRDYQDKNQMLRNDLLQAKKIFNTEITPTNNRNFKDLLYQSDFRGRRENIIAQKDDLRELQNRIRELEEGKAESPSVIPVTAIRDRKLEGLQKFQNTHTRHNEKQDLLKSTCQVKRKMELWKKWNSELKKESELLRFELNGLLEKSTEDRSVHDRIQLVSRELRARQSEKIDMNNKLDHEKTRNEQLADEEVMLKEDLAMFLSKINDDKILIEALQNQQGYLFHLLERQKTTYENEKRKFQDDMGEIQEKHTANNHILLHLKSIVQDKNKKSKELINVVGQRLVEEDKVDIESTFSMKTNTGPELTPSQQTIDSQAPPVSQKLPDQSEQSPDLDEDQVREAEKKAFEAEMIGLSEELQRHKEMFQSRKEILQQTENTVSSNENRMNEWVNQLLHTRSLLARRNAEIRDLEEEVRQLQKPASFDKKSETHLLSEPNFKEETLKKYNALAEEYQVLKSLSELLVSNNENSLRGLSVFVGTRQLYTDATQDLISLLEEESNGNKGVPNEDEEQSET